LIKHGFKFSKIHVISEGITREPLAKLEDSLPKEKEFTILSIGFRKMKRPLETLKAFHLLNNQIGKSQLWLVGWGTEETKLYQYCQKHDLTNHVKFLGRVSEEEKWKLMQRSHVLATSSVKEGWGIIVIEVNSMGTPVVAYDVPGLRDALSFENGFLTKSNPNSMAEKLLEVAQIVKQKPDSYKMIRQKCLDSSRKFKFSHSYQGLKNFIQK